MDLPYKMAKEWTEHLSQFLKCLENESNGQQVHQLRRSFESGKKKDRLLPQLAEIYQQGQTHFSESALALQLWFNQQQYKLKLGLKEVLLKSTSSADEFKEKFLRLMSQWNPDLYVPPAMPAQSSLGVSRRQMRMAMKKLHNMPDSQLSNVLKQIPTDASINQEELDGVLDQRAVQRIKSLLPQ